MAVTAKFAADFSTFSAAVQKADQQLADFAKGAGNVEKSLARMTDNFSGRKIIQDAELMARAINDAGGVATLTASQLQQAGAKAAEAAEKMKKLGMEVPPGLQEIADKAEHAAPAVEGLGARITGLVAAGAAAVAAMREVVGIGVSWVKAAGEQENATVRLSTALRAQSTFTPDLARQYDQLASAFEKTTTFSDELLMEMEALLVTVGGVMPKDMKAALTASTDLAAGLRIDLTSATELVAKALEGNFTALKKHGIAIDETAFKAEGATVVFQAIADKMGGQAAAQAATFGGEMKRLGNMINNVEETLGGLIARALKPVIDLFTALPDSVRTGIIVFGLLGTASVALATAVAGVGAAVALAAPLLGFSAAAAGAGALGLLGTAAAGATAAMGPLALAITAVFVAFKVGQTQPVSDYFMGVTLRLQGYTAAQARAMVATDNANRVAREQAAALDQQTESHKRVAPALVSYSDQLKKATTEIANLTDQQKKDLLAAQELGTKTDVITKAFHISEGALKVFTEQTQKHKEETKKSAEETKKLAEALRDYSASGATDWLSVMNKIGVSMYEGIAADLKRGRSVEELARVYHTTKSAVEEVQRAEAGYIASVKTLADAHKIEMENLAGVVTQFGYLDEKETKSILRQLALRDALKMVEQSIPGPVTGLELITAGLESIGRKSTEIEDLKTKFGTADLAAQRFAKTLNGQLFDVLKSVPQTIVAALTGGGGLLGAAKAIGSQLGAVLGGSIGTGIGNMTKDIAGKMSALGSLAGPLGSAIGSLVGPLVSLIANIGGPSKEELAARSTWGDFQKQFGTLQQAIDGVGAAYVKAGKTGTDAQRDLQAALDATHISAEAEAAALATINDVLNDYAKDQKRANELITEYGIGIEKLGPAWRNQQLTEQAEGLINDYRIMVGVLGVSIPDAADLMGSKFNDFLHIALKTGAEIPIGMKATLETMASLGELTDLNGEKITDMSKAGVTFSMTMTQGFQTVVDKLTELIDKITGTVTAIGKIPTTVPVKITYDDPGAPTSTAADSAIPMAKGGDFMVKKPTLFLVGEAGPERATFSGAGGSGGGGGGAPVFNIVVNAPNSQFDTPESRRRLAEQVGTAVREQYDRQRRAA